MADARAVIFDALRAARPKAVARPRRADPARTSGDWIERFGERLGSAGGQLLDVREEGLLMGLRRVPGIDAAANVYSAIPEVAARGVATTAAVASDLALLEFAWIRGGCAVAENGAVWHEPTAPLERVAALLAEHLVVVLDGSEVVDLLSDAYARIDVARPCFGWFLSGPSKTADIEQALVLGAHGPCLETVLLY